MQQNDYINYQGMVTTVNSGLHTLREVCDHLSMQTRLDELNEMKKKLNEHIFSVGIMGEFRRGKSTVINALLGQSIVPSDIVPCTATLNYVRWDASKYAQINFKDGTSKRVGVDELSDYITKITEESEEIAETVKDAIVYYPCMFCQNGVQIIDTPGLNDDEKMTEIAEKVIPTLDAIIMVITPDSPFSQSESEFVRSKLVTSDLGKIIFVVNKIDIIDEEDRPRLLNSIKAKIESSVLKKMEAIYGKESEEYISAKNKMGEIRILPVSARKALKGKVNNNQALIDESGYPEFEKALSKLLTEDRGALELVHPVNKILSVGKDAVETIDSRFKALELSSEEFVKIQKESMSKIEATRKEKQEEIHALKLKGKTLYTDLLPNVSDAYDSVGNKISEYIYGIEIQESDLSTDESAQELSNKLSQDINHEIEDVLSQELEIMQNKICQRLGEDISDFEGVANHINGEISEINATMKAHSRGIGANLAAAAIDGVGNMALAMCSDFVVPGIGGIISGFKEHGVKGAVVGGISGIGIGLAACTILPTIGIVGIPLAMIIGLASSFGGKAITNLFFGKKKKQPTFNSDKIKDSLNESAEKCISDMRSQLVIEDWLKNTCENAYDQVASDIDKEWESTLHTLESTLAQIKIDIELNSENKKKLQDDLGSYATMINDVFTSIAPVNEKISGALYNN